ncbi:MAG TPA: RagB/SusD family nutrient uptake outer membrane protein [Lacibacter sp.]|nr:RagB/SusD family nutrient uptake outer membrane protein [Lacibacter sp.]
MKKQILMISAAFLLLAGVSCKKEDLDITNPNQPTPSSLATEQGIKNFALGIYQKGFGWSDKPGGVGFYLVALGYHSAMGDEIFMPWGNWGWRWGIQVNTITLPGGKVIPNPIGPRQKDQLQSTNSRQAGELNAFQYEWASMYLMNGQCNALLQALDNPELKLSGDAATKKKMLQAWAYWWKGFAYSRIGSMYIAGVVNNSTDGTTTQNYVTNTAILAEAESNFAKADALLATLSANAAYTEVWEAIVPSFNRKPSVGGGVITPAMWRRHINTYRARNLMANKEVSAMTAADWTAVANFANNGLQSGDQSFIWAMTSDGNNDLAGSFYHPTILISDYAGWWMPSERLIQEFKSGDQRLDRRFAEYPSVAWWWVNPRGRGIQLGTRYYAIDIEDGGDFASVVNSGFIHMAGTYEENELMKAEALIRQGGASNINAGVTIINNVRTVQNAGLAALPSGMTQTDALEELRRERRVALFMRGTAFYDARRLGIIKPASQGGGRANAIVVVPAGSAYLGLSSASAQPCFMNYDYMAYWDVPQNELDFNIPAAGSAPVKQ